LLDAGKAYVARGPGRLVVVKGRVEALGYPLGEGASIIVPVGRAVPLLAGEEGATVEYTGERLVEWSADEYRKMDRLAGELAEYGRVMIVGPSDVGKSTLAAWTVNKMALKGFNPVMATLDVGQNENYCPGFASSNSVDPPFIPGTGGRLARACFVGSFTPRGVESRYAYCAGAIVEGSGSWVMDTDGWVGDWDGLDSKLAAARAAGPDLVVAVGLDDRYSKYLEPRVGAPVVRVPRLVESRKTREERRTHRERLLARALQGAREFAVKLSATPVYGLPLLLGDPLSPEEVSRLLGVRVYYAEQGPQGITVVVPAKARLPSLSGGRLRILRDGWERGLLAAVYEEGVPKPGIVTKISYRRMTLHVYAPIEGKPGMIEVGRARVDPEPFMTASR